MRFVLEYPEPSGPKDDFFAPGSIADVAVLAEETGFDGFALTEHPIPGAKWLDHGGHQTVDPFVGLAGAAGVTRRIRLITYLAVAPYRSPFMLAKQATTLDLVSGGRFTLGLGAGYQKSEFHALGVDFDERNELFDEALDVLPLAWAGEPFSADGRHFDARSVVQLPRPVQDPIPIWIGGNSSRARARVAAHGQGWMPFGGSADLTRTTRTANLPELPVLAGQIARIRDNAAPRAVAVDVMLHLDDDALWSDRDGDRVGAKIEQLESAGVNWVGVKAPASSPQEHRRVVQGFAERHIA